MEAAHDFLASNMELLPAVPPEVERGRRSLYPADGDLLVHELLHRGADDLPGTPPGRDDDDQGSLGPPRGDKASLGGSSLDNDSQPLTPRNGSPRTPRAEEEA